MIIPSLKGECYRFTFLLVFPLLSVSDDGSMRMGSLITVYSNGSVNANFRQRLTFACRLNLIMFPFDVQICTITFFSPTSDGKFLQIT